MAPRTRRELLSGFGVAAIAATLSGCVMRTDTQHRKDRLGQPDLVLKNCHSEELTVTVNVTYIEANKQVHSHTHKVPADFCSDMGPSYEIEEVWTHPGKYRVQAQVPEIGSASLTVTVSEASLEADTVTRYIRIDDGTLTIK